MFLKSRNLFNDQQGVQQDDSHPSTSPLIQKPLSFVTEIQSRIV